MDRKTHGSRQGAHRLAVFAGMGAGISAAGLAMACLAQSPARAAAPTQTAKYQRWTRVNPQPIRFQAALATQCASASASQQPSPHRDRYITVYVNPKGKQAMLHHRHPHFPEGAILVKEKRSAPASRTPELMTVMIKRETGYDPEGGDWEYQVLDGPTRKIQTSGKLENCRSCHLQQKETDYLFRDPYLPAKIRMALK